LGNLADRYPGLAKVVPSIGTTVEGQPIPAIHVKSRPEPAKTILFVRCRLTLSDLRPST